MKLLWQNAQFLPCWQHQHKPLRLLVNINQHTNAARWHLLIGLDLKELTLMRIGSRFFIHQKRQQNILVRWDCAGQGNWPH